MKPRESDRAAHGLEAVTPAKIMGSEEGRTSLKGCQADHVRQWLDI